MRILIITALLALAACASSGDGDPAVETGASPFGAQRGTALPPPAANSNGRTAPPEGAGAAGIDFGQWRQADPAQYAPAFQTQVRQRYVNQTTAQIRTDLEANGFACDDEQRLDCRIEIMERDCAFDWYVVLERGAREPVAGHDRMCLGAR